MSRIMINGIWYVPEITSQLELTEFEGCCYDDVEYSYEASIIKGSKNSLTAEIIEKRTGKKTYFDNTTWMQGVLHGHPECSASARDYFTVSGLNTFIQFLRQLEDKGWL
jgi:hypothetical protein